MLTLSVVELWAKNALEHGWLAISAATLAGAALYYFAQPFFPEFELPGHGASTTNTATDVALTSSLSRTDVSETKKRNTAAASAARGAALAEAGDAQAGLPASPRAVDASAASSSSGGSAGGALSKTSIPASELFRCD